MTKPLISIVLCCHNREDYLAQTLESVFAQHYQPVEIIVMDDGSTDGTQALMQQYADRVHYHRQECQGIAVARTNASNLATGEYIAYQDDDDLMPATRLTTLLSALEQFPDSSFATGDFALIDANSALTGQRWLPGAMEDTDAPVQLADGQRAVLWPEIPAVPHTTLFRRELGAQVDWFDHDFKYACSDSDFLARLGTLGPVTYVREVVSLYRRGHAALWADNLRTSCSRVQLWEKHLGLIGTSKPDLSARLHERLCDALCVIAAGLRSQPAAETDRYNAAGWLRRGLRLLPVKQRLRFEYRSKLRTPLKHLIKGKPVPAAAQSAQQ